ncbi:MAG: calcium-binding protein, partial [Hyphomonadaceae bacterium]
RGDDELVGGDGADLLSGGRGSDKLEGGSGIDKIEGGRGQDSIYGGDGADILAGGEDADNFYFKALSEGGDTFTDFQSGVDKVVLSREAFGFNKITGEASALTEADVSWVVDGAAMSTTATLIWNAGLGTLSYDPDGSGAAEAVLLATFQQGTALVLSDIWTA